MKTTSHGPEGTEGTNVAVFGRFKYRSRSVGRVTDSPFDVWAKVDASLWRILWIRPRLSKVWEDGVCEQSRWWACNHLG